MQSWQMQTVKTKFSELMKRVQLEGPQEITRYGKPVAVLISRETFDRLSQRTESLAAFMQRSPLHGMDEIDFERGPGRTSELDL